MIGKWQLLNLSAKSIFTRAPGERRAQEAGVNVQADHGACPSHSYPCGFLLFWCFHLAPHYIIHPDHSCPRASP